MKYLLVLTLISIVTGAALGTKEHVPPVKKPHEEQGEHSPHFDHEAVIGSRKAEQEFDEMSPEEAKQRLTLLVAEHDPNNDQIITKEELVEWLMHSFKNLDEEDAAEKMTEEDVIDVDDKVSWEEYLKSQYNYEPGDIEDFKKLRETNKDNEQMKETFELLVLVEDDEARFNAADANHDGMLNKEEYFAFHAPLEHVQMHEFEIKRVMKQFDKNNDGSITKKEFIGDITDKERVIAEEEQFKLYDTDNNGKLDDGETRKWVIQDSRVAATEEAEHLLNMADDNKNGELTLAEIVDHYDEFVGSQATDYGRHLEDEL
ncbi:hypothetical protein SNE40_004395 [Patella caerulea]|uniref:Reticulocalbin-3 n=1 Tax=Patella caerulea TaxID=87958 RepID=A0AAN8K2Q8_PATCE